METCGQQQGIKPKLDPVMETCETYNRESNLTWDPVMETCETYNRGLNLTWDPVMENMWTTTGNQT